MLSVVLRAGAKISPTRGHLLLPAPFKFVFGPRDTAKQQCRSSPHIRQILDLGHGSWWLFLGSSMLWLDGLSLGTETTPLFRTSNKKPVIFGLKPSSISGIGNGNLKIGAVVQVSTECSSRPKKSRVNFSCVTSDKPGEKVCCRNGCLLTAIMPPLLFRLVCRMESRIVLLINQQDV